MSFVDGALLQDILDEIDFILTHTFAKTKEQIVTDPVLSRAVVRSLEIIGEAARKISSELKEKHSEIEWKKMAGTRDRLIHDYQGIDYDIVWDIVETKLPLLKHQLKNLPPYC